jgi:RecA/RadA recombinase
LAAKKEAPVQSASSVAALMRQQLNTEAKIAHANLKGEAAKKAGAFKEIAMDPLTSDEVSQVKEFIRMKDYFATAVGVPGFPCGGISQIIGKSDSGKTTMMIEAMVSCQRAGGIVYFIDSEHKFPWDRFEAMGGVAADVIVLPVDSLEDAWDAWWKIGKQVLGVREEGILRLTDADGKVTAEVPVDRDIQVLAAWDSVAASVANRILEEEGAGDAHVAVEAKINNKSVRKMKKLVKNARIAALFINHSYMTMPMMGPPEEVVKGGEEMYFMSSLIIKLVKGEKIDRDVTVGGEKFKQKIGRKSRIEIFKGHLSGRSTNVVMNVCAPGMLTNDELAEYRKSIQGQL